MELSKEEMQVILSTILMNQVVEPAYESTVYDLCETWTQPPVIVKDRVLDILNKLIVELVEGIKEYETEHE